MDILSYIFLLGIVLSIYVYCRRSHKWNMPTNLRLRHSMFWGFMLALTFYCLLCIAGLALFVLLHTFFPEHFHC